ncbi:MAG TPA: pyridoxal-dependent decarboxylase, partial [Thermotogota bacterium]|nr:pyridoxal-dependent decarboxylase [Thermotogota bacterium]
MLLFLMDDHADWRKFFHPDDHPVVTEDEKSDEDFQDTLQKTREALVDLAGQLQDSSTPWFSPRYLGHMNTDTLMAANLGYMLTILYNPNNCAYEGSPATTSLEIEVGRQLAALMGYDQKKAWGHITSGGTIANYEAIWLARNLASFPLAVRACCPELVAGLEQWQLLNLSTAKILDLIDQTKENGCFEQVKAHMIREEMVARRYYSSRHKLYARTLKIDWDYTHTNARSGEKIQGKRRMYLHLYYDEQRATDEKIRLNERLDLYEEELLSGRLNTSTYKTMLSCP